MENRARQIHTQNTKCTQRMVKYQAFAVVLNGGETDTQEDDEVCSDSSNDVYCRIKFKQMINFLPAFRHALALAICLAVCAFAFSSVILSHIVERQSDFNKDLFFGSH